MSEQNAPTARGESAHKWIVIGSIVGVAIVIVALAISGLIPEAN